MASQAENVARVQEGLDAFNRGDVESVLALLADEVEIFSSPELANPGSYRGHEGYLRWVGQWLDAWDELELELQRMEAVGERHVIAEVRQVARGRGSGIAVDMLVTFMWELDDEAMTALHLYPTWDVARKVAERREREG